MTGMPRQRSTTYSDHRLRYRPMCVEAPCRTPASSFQPYFKDASCIIFGRRWLHGALFLSLSLSRIHNCTGTHTTCHSPNPTDHSSQRGYLQPKFSPITCYRTSIVSLRIQMDWAVVAWIQSKWMKNKGYLFFYWEPILFWKYCS